jgi:hypothetical protein
MPSWSEAEWPAVSSASDGKRSCSDCHDTLVAC